MELDANKRIHSILSGFPNLLRPGELPSILLMIR